MQIYPAELADVNLCCQMNMSYTTDYVWQMRTRGDGRTIDIHFDTIRLPRPMRVEYPRSPDELIAHWQQEGCFLTVRNLKEETVGFVDAQAQPWQNVLWIFNLVIAPPHRRQGFAAMLLEAANRWAIEQKLQRLMLEVQTKNHPAISFAQKHGFQFCGYNERYYPSGDIALFFSRST
ncbi:MAG: GNAT family N-acetyltransferase [Anaerolineae bacterium]|nr:GNAT family N-acetyltransferase [Anaerolineae bacterium]